MSQQRLIRWSLIREIIHPLELSSRQGLSSSGIIPDVWKGDNEGAYDLDVLVGPDLQLRVTKILGIQESGGISRFPYLMCRCRAV